MEEILRKFAEFEARIAKLERAIGEALLKPQIAQRSLKAVTISLLKMGYSSKLQRVELLLRVRN